MLEGEKKMKLHGKFLAIGCIGAAIGGLTLSLAQAEGSGIQAEALPASKLQGRLQPEPQEKDAPSSVAAFQTARRQAIQKAAPQRAAPLNAALVLTPRIAYKKGAGYLKFEEGYFDAQEDTFGLTLDSWVHVAFSTKKPSRQILLLVNGEAREASLKLLWAKGKMSASQTALLSGKGSKVIPLILQTEAPGKYTIVFRIRRENTSGSFHGVPFVFRSVEILDIT
jgi:hypothetical protein